MFYLVLYSVIRGVCSTQAVESLTRNDTFIAEPLDCEATLFTFDVNPFLAVSIQKACYIEQCLLHCGQYY